MVDATITGDRIDVLDEISNFSVGDTFGASDLSSLESDADPSDVLRLLCTLGLLELENHNGDGYRFAIGDIRQLYFIECVSRFSENDLKIFRSWKEGRKGRITSENIFYGTQFLHYLENERKELQSAEPIRVRTVVKAIIKANFKHRKDPLYLSEYHREPEQFKLIGGLVEDPDVNHRKALAREIDEEIPNFDMNLGEDYHLVHLKGIKQDVVSYTYGAYSEYSVHYYLVDFDENKKLNLSDQNRWLTIEEIKNGETQDGIEIFPLEAEVIELMDRQPESLRIPSRFNLTVFVREYWQEIVAIISVLSFILVVLRLLVL